MKALVYHGPGQKAWEEVPDPELVDPTDVIVRVDTTCLLYTSPSPRDISGSRMPSSA